MCRSQWPRGLRHVLSSLFRTLWSWVLIPLKAWMSVCTFILCLCCLCVGSGHATVWSLVQGVKKDYKAEEEARAQQKAVDPTCSPCHNVNFSGSPNYFRQSPCYLTIWLKPFLSNRWVRCTGLQAYVSQPYNDWLSRKMFAFQPCWHCQK
jgi:hypothetical protein